jgi:hypothetical protein
MTFQPQIDTKGSSQLLWVRPNESWPTQVAALVATEGVDPVVISFGGGNAGLSNELKADMPAYFSGAFRGFTGTALSGGTGHFDAERNVSSFEITQVPALLASENRCIAIGSSPLTKVPGLGHHHGNVLTDSYGGELDPRHHANVVVALHPSDRVQLGWDGDLGQRMPALEELLDLMYGVGGFMFNGGDVTTGEIYTFLRMTTLGAKLFVADESGREADKFIKGFRTGNYEETNAKGLALPEELVETRKAIRLKAVRDNVIIIPAFKIAETRKALIDHKLLRAA